MVVVVNSGVVYESFDPTGIPFKLHNLASVEVHLRVLTPMPVKAGGSAVSEVTVAPTPPPQ